jgi:hypothetical protein
MTGYDVPQTIKYTSLEELIEIFRWLRNRGEEESHPTVNAGLKVLNTAEIIVLSPINIYAHP